MAFIEFDKILEELMKKLENDIENTGERFQTIEAIDEATKKHFEKKILDR